MILVTGATGFIGGHLVERLIALDRSPVRCLVRRPTAAAELPPSVEVIEGHLETAAGLTEALAGVDSVIHLAGVTKARAPLDYERGNRLATTNLVVAAATAANVRRFVHVSSLAAAGPSPVGHALLENESPHPVSLYGRSKLAGEDAVRQSPLAARAVIIRPPVVYGPRDRDVYQILRGAARGWMAQIGREERRFSYIYVGDLVDGLIAAMDCPRAAGQIFYLANPTAVSWTEFAGVAARLMHRKVRAIAIHEKAAYVLGLCAECWTRLTGSAGILSRDKVREACCTGWVCDPTRARRELGFTAQTGLEDGLRRTLNWYKEAGWLKF